MSDDTSTEFGYREVLKSDAIDVKYGFKRISDNIQRIGYLINMRSTEILNDDRRITSALDLFFIQMNGARFKYTVTHFPYFLLGVEEGTAMEIEQFLKTKFGGDIAKIEKVTKENLDLPNHLAGIKQLYLKVIFFNQNSLAKIRKQILIVIKNNTDRIRKNDKMNQLLTCNYSSLEHVTLHETEPLDKITDIREYDVPYHVRVSIDLKIFCGMWYSIEINGNNKSSPDIKLLPEVLERPEPVVLAFDIETTKLPLKFPDSSTDQIMMISYIIDGQGYLITNREIISVDVENFEYTPKPEFEGNFTVFNEKNEMNTIQRFFNHIMQIRPNIFVTYNGDFFDWPFIETRAHIHGINMSDEIGVSKSKDSVYFCRPAVHMDCLCWVKRDSYLPVGSQGLKAVAKAKLRYDPIELDPEEMCRMAKEQPQTLSNYSVSDAIATFYLYTKYVQPFIFALSTIIPMQPDEILRKGSGTLCETLLMVEAYKANIVYPNKQQNETLKLTNDGHFIDTETYVGGHVEALECGVYRADIPCRFRLDRNTLTKLVEDVDKVLEHAIVVEEGVPIEKVNNFSQISYEIKLALQGLYDIPNRVEQPVIYHLDVGAMYPNIILTNRLQPSAVVYDADCAVCDFNSANAKCKRVMKWQWRGETLPATKNELQRIRQQLEMEKFPPLQVGGSQRAFHELSQEDQAEYEKKRLLDYCRKVYKKSKVVKLEERISTICQKENSFYVDTVRAFRDRRYDYKVLTKLSKKSVLEAIKKGDAVEIKAAKNKEILYDSLQLAHKCILNSFYGYVMRKGARWHSMPMAGIVCLTGSNIITKARYIIERIGRPLELDTDGIWCILPASFPQVFTIKSSYQKKSAFNISYPNAVLNAMVKDTFTNNQYHELVKEDGNNGKPVYQLRSENSIFFEVDGPYLAMVLPAAKEEGKKLKKRYAVFNFDGSMAELKGFEVKRRGELQLIKNFQSSVFESFLSGSTLEECYANVAKIANYWLDVLYSHGHNLPDSELFELISENRSMSRKLEDYGAQKSTSISTAKRLAEFLGDQMVKDAGLACKFVISKKPEGCPVTERAIPLAIFQCEPAIRRCYLSRWLRDTTMGDADIRDVIDWNYYIERLSGAIQKIITIPAAIQGLNNPVPRVLHPDWLLKRILTTNDKLKQRQITDMFTVSKRCDSLDSREVSIKQFGSDYVCKQMKTGCGMKRKQDKLQYNWTEYIGSPPKIGNSKAEIINWILYQKKKWIFQLDQKREIKGNIKRKCYRNSIQQKSSTVSEFLYRSKCSLLSYVWQVIQLTQLDNFGHFVVWAIIENELHKIKLKIPRIFYINQRSQSALEDRLHGRRVWCYLPRGTHPYNIYQYKLDEQSFKCNGISLVSGITMTDIEGMYETKISLESRFLIEMGCLCKIKENEASVLSKTEEAVSFTFCLEQLKRCNDTNSYLNGSWEKLKKIFLYQQHSLGKRQIWGFFLPASQHATIVILDTIRTNQIQNMNTLYASERTAYLKKVGAENCLQPEYISFEIFMEIDIQQVYRHIQRCLSIYNDNKRGPTVLCTQTSIDFSKLKSAMPLIIEFPSIKIHISDDVCTMQSLSWQHQTSRSMIRHFLNFNNVINLMLKQSQYLNIPIGNLPSDPVLTGTDIFYARLLQKNNYILWWSPTNRPDMGGKEAEDYKLLTEVNTNVRVTYNKPRFYSGICIALTIQNLAISALLHSDKIYDVMNGCTSTIFGSNVQTTLEDLLVAGGSMESNSNEIGSNNADFRILRSMVNGWLREVSLNENVFSDYHIAHFYRWIRSSKALMYDPAICKALTSLMEKILVGILIELKRLGVVIIFADVNHIVINTKKKVIIEAINYVEFIVQSIRKKEMYHSVQLSFKEGWDNLLWLDPTNYGGIRVTLPSSGNVIVDSDRMFLNSTENILDIHFSIGSQISKNNEFKVRFQEFAEMFIQSLLGGKLNEIIRPISQKILGLTLGLHRKYGVNDSASVLRYIHATMKILNINNDNEEDIIVLRRNLLKIVGVNEYCEDDTFLTVKDFMLISATCKACNEFRDINLFFDEYQNVRLGKKVWICHRCYVAYDNTDIESSAIVDLNNKLSSYILQDMKCFRCHGLKSDNYSKVCCCGGKYAALLKKDDLKKQLRKLLHVAQIHQMDMLNHTLLGMLD